MVIKTKVYFITEINNKLLSNSITDVLFAFNESTKQSKITNNNGGDIELKWYNPTTPQCGQSGNGSKVDYKQVTVIENIDTFGTILQKFSCK